MPILGPNGRPMEFKKASAPKLGSSFGDWAGREFNYNILPGGAVLQFDLSRLTLADYRAMRHHPQVNASLTGLTFMMHQIDWSIECKDKKIAAKVEANFREIWTGLVRGMSHAFWAGFSPNALEYDNSNDSDELDIVLKRVKDLAPEDCTPHWKIVEGAVPPENLSSGALAGAPPGAPGTRIRPKFKEYNGINQYGAPGPIPVEHTLWYPLLMENGNYFGRKLLNACFTPWYFSTLIHLFANRYYERFGEPTPVGRAPFDEEMDLPDGSTMTGKEIMTDILQNLRNRGSVTLPSDRSPVTKEFDYTIGFLESQMRGADFERYLTRLDEEISLGLFQPLLLMKSSDVGSNNLGVQHTQTWLWMLNAVAGDMAEYLTIIAERLKAINFSPNAPRCAWVPRKMGKENAQTIRSIAVELIRRDKAKVDLAEFGQVLGMSLEEVEQLRVPQAELAPDTIPERDLRQRQERVQSVPPKTAIEPRATGREISHRLRGQVTKAYNEATFGKTFKPDIGYRKRFETSLQAEGYEPGQAQAMTRTLYSKLEDWLHHAINLGPEEFSSAQDFMAIVDRKIDSLITELVDEP